MSRSVFPPFLSLADIRAAAESVTRRYFGSVRIPVDIELLVEFHFDLTIVPVPELEDRFGIDGFATRTQIAVDYSSWKRNTNRYRFTLAHELGHHVLHSDLLNATAYSTAQEFLDARRTDLTWQAARNRYEWQAHCFARNILLPPAPLAEEITAGITALRTIGHQVNPSILADCERLAVWIARRANVSREVVMRRAAEDGHWIAHRESR